MVEAQVRELMTAVQNVQAQVTASEGGTDDSAGAGGSDGTSLWGVEGRRGHAEPREVFSVQWRRRDWSVVFRSNAVLVHPALQGEMQRVERLPTAETNAGLLDDEQVQASTDLWHLLLHSTAGPALNRVVNAGSAEGLRAWQLLVQRYDSHIRSRTAGQLLSLLQFDFSGDMLVKLEAYERDLALYEQAWERSSQMAYVWGLS